jgi:hypothetical protein
MRNYSAIQVLFSVATMYPLSQAPMGHYSNVSAVKPNLVSNSLPITHSPRTQDTAAAWTSAEQSRPGMSCPTQPPHDSISLTMSIHSSRCQQHNQFESLNATHLEASVDQRARRESSRTETRLNDVLDGEIVTPLQTGRYGGCCACVVEALTYEGSNSVMFLSH